MQPGLCDAAAANPPPPPPPRPTTRRPTKSKQPSLLCRLSRGPTDRGARDEGGERASESVRQTNAAAAESVVNVCVCARVSACRRRSVCAREETVECLPSSSAALRRRRQSERVACKKRQSDHKERRATETGAGREGGSGRSDVYVCAEEEQSRVVSLLVRSSLRAAADAMPTMTTLGYPPPHLKSKMSPTQSVSQPPFFARLDDRDRRTERYNLAIVRGGGAPS